ncbi:hypothetical protein [Streptomyces ipomoeae]|uniref:Uncharacterized protein n=1 Tax=Streptomyces ipomoeae 91-03 TaxID=698759 RepID=L1KQ88_9ACTN|nr:hypothetical protein [Streptomyces ipomoeae]EKX62543.1 hypothetical protein STRIP9103_05545 [Streptomyces ipomoeae 91-03]MDX2692336.1 hypothetical protein [Streptomyces ipomoeae]MDX2837834.1 hypothetical protein [Streptomyces ipomoeae]
MARGAAPTRTREASYDICGVPDVVEQRPHQRRLQLLQIIGSKGH